MKKKKLFVWIRLIGFLLYFFATVFALRYQAAWRMEMEAKLQLKQAMEDNGNGGRVDDLLREAECFPVKPDAAGQVQWSFDDGYGGVRTYGGERKHEGIDIMASEDLPGCLQICAMTDGVIEQMGWLELGGYRIGIRSKSGIYYYYAHLAQYAKGLQIGDTVKAGDVIGDMGNTGYGPEKTTGKFPVHLHFGIYVQQNEKDQSINPYPLLRYLERSTGIESK